MTGLTLRTSTDKEQQTEQRHVRYRAPRSATVRRERAPVASRLLLVVHLSRERTLEPVRQDSSFARWGARETCSGSEAGMPARRVHV
jgi:hypothetical protein